MATGDAAPGTGVLLVADRSRPGSFTLRVGGTDQSYVDLNDPLHLEFDYVQRIADVLDCLAPSGQRLRVVHVGGGGLTLPRYVAVTRPQSAQVVLEPDTGLTALVREHLPLPPRSGIKVRPVDGRTGLAALADDYADVVVLDAFVAGRVPGELTTAECFAECRRVLAPGGCVVVNVTDRGPLGYTRRVLAGMVAVFESALLCAEPSTLKGRRFGNVVLAGSTGPLPVASIAERAGRGPFPYRVLHGVRLSQLLAGAAPLTGAGEWSPEPPPGFLTVG